MLPKSLRQLSDWRTSGYRLNPYQMLINYCGRVSETIRLVNSLTFFFDKLRSIIRSNTLRGVLNPCKGLTNLNHDINHTVLKGYTISPVCDKLYHYLLTGGNSV